MGKMRAVQVSRPGGPLEAVEREIPTPGRNAVRVRVQACGVCHSDTLVLSGGFPASSTRASPATKSPASSTPSAPA
jgi:D-arabinose 1-dehydrogenase-like Zn-dependent alcohol dehydrogenase